MGVKKNEAEAFKWFKKAAEQGHAEAQLELAKSYFEVDNMEAVKWVKKAAQQGHAEAQFNLAGCYYYGMVVEKNEAEAVKWLKKAAEQGDAKAKEMLEEINRQKTVR